MTKPATKIENLIAEYGIDKTIKITGCSERAIYRKQAAERKGENAFTEHERRSVDFTLELMEELELLHQEVENQYQENQYLQKQQFGCSLYDLIKRGSAIRETYLDEHADHWFKQQCELVEQDGRALLPLHQLR
ncbi:hypothetical protein [Shewanella sp. MBTL60-007]|uniref:hypothetical protein n=1 Tax=Shewanella sp. MBTL60-007 TaxID=2815911 RepID=UPI001BC26AA0|nr:hypothetical protein [Shewanella sp. MBTL60-007]GIU31799.1 hypothetical protein TUM3792_43830 [Shewanella sp. MBTL60-007]